MKELVAVFITMLWLGMGISNHLDLLQCEKKQETDFGVVLTATAYIVAPIMWPIVSTGDAGRCNKDEAQP